MDASTELAACTPHPVHPNGFNPHAVIPYGCTTEHIRQAMNQFSDFLMTINLALNRKGLPRLETIMMLAGFSSLVGEFIGAAIPRHCPTLIRNQYHNGHPDLLPTDRFPANAMKLADEGIEVKGSRHMGGWQGHNPEDTWLMVFVFEANRPNDENKGMGPKPFRFLFVAGAKVVKGDWKFSGRAETSRRTITASITKSGKAKMFANWIYRDPDIKWRKAILAQMAVPLVVPAPPT